MTQASVRAPASPLSPGSAPGAGSCPAVWSGLRVVRDTEAGDTHRLGPLTSSGSHGIKTAAFRGRDTEGTAAPRRLSRTPVCWEV